jgi:RNA polymerase sigma factor (sigma-70 family)
MNNQEIQKYQKRARYVATKSGYPELAEDFSQELFIEFLQNPDRGATVDQLFIDYLRRIHGRPGTPGGDARILARANTISIDSFSDDGKREEIQLPAYDDPRSIDDGPGSNPDVGKFAKLFRGREAQIYQAYFVDEITEESIGKCFGISESRVSQILKPMKKKIKDAAILQEGYQRMEWDESFLSFKVNWLEI